MAQHKFMTPRVVYLGQAYPGRDAREPRTATSSARVGIRVAAERQAPRRAEALAAGAAR